MNLTGSITDGTITWGIGKYKHYQMKDLPLSYMEWCVTNWDPKSKGIKRIKRELERRVAESNGNPQEHWDFSDAYPEGRRFYSAQYMRNLYE